MEARHGGVGPADLPHLQDATVSDTLEALEDLWQKCRDTDDYAMRLYALTRTPSRWQGRGQIKRVGILLDEAKRVRAPQRLGIDDWQEYKRLVSRHTGARSTSLRLGERLVDLIRDDTLRTVTESLNTELGLEGEQQIALEDVSVGTLDLLWRPLQDAVEDGDVDEAKELISLTVLGRSQVGEQLAVLGYRGERADFPHGDKIRELKRKLRAYRRLMAQERYDEAQRLLDEEISHLFGELSHAHFADHRLRNSGQSTSG